MTPGASGGTGSYTWSVIDGTLPTGLTLSPATGEISGTPTASGTFPFFLVATDGANQQVTQTESVTIAADPSVTSSVLPGGEQGVTYDMTPTGSGGTGSYTWSVTDGTLPTGLTLSGSTGEISGIPTASGTFPFTLVATDGNSQQGTQTESVTIAADPSITSPALPAGEEGVTYDVTPTASGGTGSYTWSVTDGTLPTGLTLSVSNGEISGIPTASGTFPFTLVVTDADDQQVTQTESVTIATDPSFTSPVLPGGERSVTYDVTPTASGGTGSYTWSVTDGSLPTGLTLSVSTGEISGTPTASGTFPFTLVATDSRQPAGHPDRVGRHHQRPGHHLLRPTRRRAGSQL